MKVKVFILRRQGIYQKEAGEMRKGRRERIEKERIKRKRQKGQFEEEEGLKEINKFTWTSNTRKSQVHFMMKSFI